jgi:hypothetical protein
VHGEEEPGLRSFLYLRSPGAVDSEGDRGVSLALESNEPTPKATGVST